MLPALPRRVNKGTAAEGGRGSNAARITKFQIDTSFLGFRNPFLAVKLFSMRPTEFIATLRDGPVGAAYFLRGPDRFLQEECRKAVINSIPPDSRQWCLEELEFAAGQLARALEGAEQMPMLGGHTFLLIADPEDFKQAGDEDVEALRRYLERPSPFSTLVFLATEPDRRRRFISLLEKKAQIVELRSPDRHEAGNWVKQFLLHEGVEIAATLAEEIAGKFEISQDSRSAGGPSAVNLLWMRTELEKLLTARPGLKRLEAIDLDVIVAFREEREIGKLLRAMGERKCAVALTTLRELLASKVAETLILWCIGDLFRQALRGVAGYDGRGGWSRGANPYSTSEIAPITQRNYPHEELLQALRAVRRADLGIKSSWKDSRILLEFLVWQIVVGKETASEQGIGSEVPLPSTET
jgi:DNA polymerase III delta subunit